MKNKLLSLFLLLGSYAAYSQVGIGTPMPNSSAQLEVVASDKGVLIPKIKLTSTADVSTIKNGNVNSLLVFNTANISDITPGYYYWYDNKWNRIVISKEISLTPGTVIFNPITTGFTYMNSSGTPLAIDFSQIIAANQTVTKLINNGAGSYTYINETGTAVNIDIVGDVRSNFSSIINDPSITSILQQISTKTEGSVTFDSATNVFSYTDSAGNRQTVDINTIVKGNETLTTLTNDGAGSYTYKNEAGADVNIDVVGDVTSNFNTIANNPAVTSLIQNISTQTTGSVTFDSATNVFSYTDSAGNRQTVDINTIVKGNETLTTLTNNGAGSYTYKNEAGANVNIDVVGDVTSNFNTIANNPAVTSLIQNISTQTTGSVTFDSATNVFSYTDSAGNRQTVDINTIVKGNETLTTLTNNGAGSYTYKNEAGANVNIDVVGDVTSNFSTIANNPAVTSLIQNISTQTTGSVTFDSATNVFSYTDSAGNRQTVDINTIVKGNETLTTLTNNGTGSYTYKNEAGADVNIDVVGDVTSNFSTIANNPAVTSLIQNISTQTMGSVTFDSATNVFSYTDSAGNRQTVDINTIVKGNETKTNLNQAVATGIITYTNEDGIDQTTIIKSSDTGNIIKIGTDGGVLLTAASISSSTTVSNTSSVNDLSTTVNGVTGTVIPIINTNEVSLTGSTLITTVNGVASTGLDLTSALASATTVSNTSNINSLTTSVNGVSGAAVDIVNSNVLSVIGNTLTSTINGEASNTIDLTSAIASGTTNSLSLAGNILTSNINGVSVTSDAVSGLSNASANNTATVTVNGITSSGAPIINSNETSLTGSTLVTTVNGVASTGLDLTPALASATTVANASTANSLTTTVNGVSAAAVDVINSNETSLAGSTLITTVNGVTSTGLDLTPALASATTVSNTSNANSLSTTVNGVAATAVNVINSNETSLTGTTLVTTVNGIASTGLDLTPALASATTNTLGLTGNTLTSNVNGVSVTSDAVSGVSNASANNTSTVTVNGITSSGAPIVNSNETSLTGTTLVTTVNGIASTGLDLTPALASATTNTLGLTGNTLTSNVNGVSVTSYAVSGVSNASANNTSTVTVNGITSSGAPIVNSNETSLTGTTLVTTVNGIASTGLDLTPALASATTNTLGLTGNTLTSNVNGVSVTSDAVSGVSNASANNTSTVTVNGITSSGAPIVNSNETSLTGTTLVTTVNGIASTGLDLTPALASATTNTLGLTGNTLTSNVNGVSVTSYAVSGVSNASANNTSAVTVNGITSSGAPIVNSNETSLTGTTLVTTVNGIASTGLDLTPALASATTNTLGLTGNTLTSNVNGVSVTSDAVSGVSNASANNTSTVTVNGITSSGAPIVNSNETSLTGTTLVTTVNGIASTGLDLTPALASATTVSNTSNANSLSTTVNGVAATAVNVINSNETLLTGTTLVTTVNGVASTGLDLTPALASATTNTLGLTGNTLTSNVNGVSVTSDAVSGVSNASVNNTSTVTVNGITSSGAPIVNSNETSLTGTTLFTTVNGIASTGLDLGPLIKENETVTVVTPIVNTGNSIAAYSNEAGGTPVEIKETITTQSQNLNTGTITFTNEAGTAVTSQVISTNLGNLITAGADGGGFVNSAVIKANETITAIAPVVTTGNTIATYSNETGGTPVNIKETVTSLRDVVTQNTDTFGQLFDVHTLTYTDETNTAAPIDLSVLVKGSETLTSLLYDGASHSLIYKDEKGVSTQFNMVDLIGDTETLTKLEVNSAAGALDYTAEDSQLHHLNLEPLLKEPWFSSATNTGATLNTENIYTNGWVGIGYVSPSSAPNEKLRVNGAISTVNTYYADYVFEDYFKGFSNIKADYKFRPLSDIEGYIKDNNHLPGITPITQLEKTNEGYSFNISELSVQLLEKTEELYLHIIEQNKINEAQSKELELKNKEVAELRETSKAMNLRLEKLEKLLAKKKY